MPRSGFTVASYVKRRRRKHSRKARALTAPIAPQSPAWNTKIPRSSPDSDYKYGTVTREDMIVSPPPLALPSMPSPPTFVPPPGLNIDIKACWERQEPTSPQYSPAAPDEKTPDTPPPCYSPCATPNRFYRNPDDSKFYTRYSCSNDLCSAGWWEQEYDDYLRNGQPRFCPTCGADRLYSSPSNGVKDPFTDTDEDEDEDAEEESVTFVDLTGEPGDSINNPILIE